MFLSRGNWIRNVQKGKGGWTELESYGWRYTSEFFENCATNTNADLLLPQGLFGLWMVLNIHEGLYKKSMLSVFIRWAYNKIVIVVCLPHAGDVFRRQEGVERHVWDSVQGSCWSWNKRNWSWWTRGHPVPHNSGKQRRLELPCL